MMVGIVSYGGYIPRLRMNRLKLIKAMGWFAPNLVSLAEGERSICNWDEDAMTMAVASGLECLTGYDKSNLDGIFLASTTLPFADRDSAGILKTALNIPDVVTSANVTSTQKAGTTALIMALDAIKGRDKHGILVTASDHRHTRLAGLHEMWFGDGSASLLVGKNDVIAEFLGSCSVTHDFVDHYRGTKSEFDYNWEERWVREEGYTKILPQAIHGVLKKTGLQLSDITRMVYPCPFTPTHAAIAKGLGATPEQSVANMHGETGECGVAHPFIMFIRELEKAEPGDKLLMAGFGQGAEAMIFEVTPKIKDLLPPAGIAGNLTNKRMADSYTKYLKFRDMINTELGVRAEGSFQTALSELWRNRKFVLGFVGGKCNACGTPQIPSRPICVNPHCGKIDSQEEYEFSTRSAKVLTYTGDMLAVSADPPAIYGMVEFKDGGRMMMDFTDCSLKDMAVGMPVTLSFRRKYYDKERGFTGYFWKAVPKPAPPKHDRA